MSYTSEQLLEIADSIASRGCVIERGPLADIFRAHADALEEIESLKAKLKVAEEGYAELAQHRSDSALRLMCGELSAGEMRSVRAILAFVKARAFAALAAIRGAK